MKELLIFVASIVQYNRGPKQPVPYKAGFFYVDANTGIPVFISSGPSLPNPKKGNCPAEVELLTAVFGGSLFFVRLQTSTVPNNEPPHLHFEPIPAHLSPALSTAGSTYSVSFIS